MPIDRTPIAPSHHDDEHAGKKQPQQPLDHAGQPPDKIASARRDKRDPAFDAHDDEPNHCLASPMAYLG